MPKIDLKALFRRPPCFHNKLHGQIWENAIQANIKGATLSGNLFFLVSMSDGQRLPASQWLSVSDTLFPIPHSCRCIPLHVQASAPYQARHGMPSPLWVCPSNTPALRQYSILYGSSSCHRKNSIISAPTFANVSTRRRWCHKKENTPSKYLIGVFSGVFQILRFCNRWNAR